VYDVDMPRALIALLIAAIAPCASAQQPPIGIIDFYGLRSVRESQVRAALQVSEGDAFPASKAEVERRLQAVPGVARARISGVCCEAGKSIMFVGIEEGASAAPTLRPAPTGSVRLPDDLLQLGAAVDAAREAAVRRGESGEDQSAGHSLMHDSAGRALQLRYIPFAIRDSALLRDVLTHSSDAAHRARAAEVIAYGGDKGAAIRDLTAAVSDPASEVRNDAVRALGLLAIYARLHPELGLSVSPAPFIDMLGSPVWTDRNKSSMAVMQISEGRDPALLAALRARALPALVEMARWKSASHAVPSFIILGRIAGMTDDATYAAWARGDRESVIAAAMKSER
jgi:hypothetical protein